MHDLATNRNFADLWNRLLRYSVRYKISHEDLEDIVSESIVKALEHFDEDRGSFESLCMVIIKNKVFNLTRHNKVLFLLVLIDDTGDIIDPNTKTLEDKEQNIMALKFIDKLKKNLDEDELKLLNAMYEMCESSDKPNISEASRIIGIEPIKGWDIFRRIQRKAEIKTKKIYLPMRSDYSIRESSVSEEPMVIEVDLVFIKFLESLSAEDVLKLEKIYYF